MAVTGWKAATNNADTGLGGIEWFNRNDLHTDNTAGTDSGGFTFSTMDSQWYGFGFTTGDIPSSSTIDGIEVRIRGTDAFGDGGWHLEIFLSDDGGSTWTTSNRMPTSGDFIISGTSPVTQTIGGSSDLLGLSSPADSDIRSDDFRVRIRYNGDNFQDDVELEFMEVRVHYTAGGGGGLSIPVANNHYRKLRAA